MGVNKKYLHSDISHSTLEGFYNVLKRLPFGLPVTAYKNAMTIELTKMGVKTDTEKELNIYYDQQVISSVPVDMVLNGLVIVTIISSERITDSDIMALKNRLRLSDYEVGLLLNFGIEGEHKRLVYTNELKKTDQADIY